MSTSNEKANLIKEVLTLQNTLEDLSNRVQSVVDENSRLRQENDILGQYIDDLSKKTETRQENQEGQTSV